MYSASSTGSLNLAFLPTVHAGCREFHGAARRDFEEFLLISWLSDNTC